MAAASDSPGSKPYLHGNKGFTLIEALLAIFIFSWIGLGAYQILDQITRAKETSLRQSDRLSSFQRLNWRLSQDFRQMIVRPIVDERGDKQSWLVHEGEEFLIEFTRQGWSNPLNWPRSDLQRVAYTIDIHPEHDDRNSDYYNDERLYLLRYYWQVLDRTQETEPRIQALLADVADFRVQYWDHTEKEWIASVDTVAAEDRPAAYEVSIVLESEEVLSYIFRTL